VVRQATAAALKGASVSKTCYNCGTENADSETFCHKCGATLTSDSLTSQRTGLQAGVPEERMLWDGGDIQLTTEAVLIGMATDAPDVVPLDTIYAVEQDERCLTLKVKDGGDKQCFLDDPSVLARLVQEQIDRHRHAIERTEQE
jgi:hypothetical protein